MKKERGSITSSFGVSGRESHDSSHFYASRMYQQTPQENDDPYHENPLPEEYFDQVIHASAEDMHHLPDACVHLMVTSPPYNARKDYDDDLTLEEYLKLLHAVFSACFRVLVPGGRACINLANLGRKPYIPLNAYVAQIMIDIGFLMRAEVIWDKAASVGTSTAWGSWMSPSNPTLRDVHEYILIFSKGSFKRQDLDRESTITREQFLEYTKSVWSFPTVSAKKIGHPAPFPEELPARLIQLYTYAGEVVLDPFMGSGSTAIAAKKSGRHYVGYEIIRNYVELARQRIAAAV